MIELSIDNLMIFYGANKIFENISFDIKTGGHIGLIGENGCGKTSILKILMGLEEQQAGSISIRKDCKLGYLNQIPEYAEETSVMEFDHEGIQRRLCLLSRRSEKAAREAVSVAK